MRGIFLAATAAAALAMMATAVQAQSLPPKPGSTSEYRDGSLLMSFGKARHDEGIDLLLRACDMGDAAGCAQIAQITGERLPVLAKRRPGAEPAAFARKTIQLLQQRCSPTIDLDRSCGAFAGILFSFSSTRSYPEIVLEGGRFLAGRCIAGQSDPGDCSFVEKFLQEGSTELATLQNWVDQRFEEACASGDSAVCERGFFRKNVPDMTKALGGRLLRLTQAAGHGCADGSPVICAAAGTFLFEFSDEQGRAYAADFISTACQLPPKTGERNLQQWACDAEKKIRADLISPK